MTGGFSAMIAFDPSRAWAPPPWPAPRAPGLLDETVFQALR